MYTGIVLGTEKVASRTQHQGYISILIHDTQNFFNDVFLGASVAIDGTCLTVSQIVHDKKLIGFDIADQTLSLTTLDKLQAGTAVNIERSFKMGMENGGHSLYGHIEGVAEIVGHIQRGETLHLDLKIPAEKIKYFFHKGFIGVHGCSLTVNHVDKQQHLVAIDLIPETLRLTNLKSLQLGDFVNFEIDQTTRTLVDTMEGIYLNRMTE